MAKIPIVSDGALGLVLGLETRHDPEKPRSRAVNVRRFLLP